MPMTTRVALAYLALMGMAVGVWAYGFPHEFYDGFPGLGRTWVSMDGPYNEHLVRDAGSAFLMMGALAGLGLWKPTVAPPLAIGIATLCFNGLHFAYHATHLGMFGLLDRALNVVALGSAVLASAWLLNPKARVHA